MKRYRTILVKWSEIGNLTKILNEYAQEGWIVRTSTSIGMSIIVILERSEGD